MTSIFNGWDDEQLEEVADSRSEIKPKNQLIGIIRCYATGKMINEYFREVC